MVTCYDACMARWMAGTGIDMLLVGDSVAQVVHGHAHTVQADMAMMVMHTAAVARVQPKQFIVADMPFLSYRKSLSESMQAAERLMKAGAHALKLEGLSGNEALIQHLVQSGIPVMGHLGLTPQHVHQLGGYGVQGKTLDAADLIAQQAAQSENLGCFALVLECVPAALAKRITHAQSLLTIGIGAGPSTDGQVLVLHDLLGFGDFSAKFVRQYLDGKASVQTALHQYAQEVQSGLFPMEAHAYDTPT